MNEKDEIISAPAETPGPGLATPAEDLDALEAQICQLAGHLAAATCRFLLLVADFDGRPIPTSPPLPPTSGNITGCHDAAITSDTIIPNSNGDRLDLDHAIWVAFANARLTTTWIVDRYFLAGGGPCGDTL